MNNFQLGLHGEELAVRYLKRHGYKILERNFRTHLGEVDIVARYRGVIRFVEVKTRSSDEKGLPMESITQAKQRKMTQVALIYLKKKGMEEAQACFDVVSIEKNVSGTDTIQIIENAFDVPEGSKYK